MDGPGIAVGPLKLEELSVIIKGLGAAPESLDDLEPFLGVGVAGLVILGKPETERSIFRVVPARDRSEEHTSELQSLMRTSYAVFCLKKKNQRTTHTRYQPQHH